MISMARSNMARHKMEEAAEEEDLTACYIQKRKQLYEIEAKKCESSIDAVGMGVSYAEAIKKVHHYGFESRRLFMKLREICQRVHGPDHKLTKLVCSTMKSCSTVWMRYNGNGDRFVFVDYDSSFKMCVGMRKNPLEGEGLPFRPLSIDEAVFDNGTIVYSSPQPIESNNVDQFMLGDMRLWLIMDDEKKKEYNQDFVDGRLKPAKLNFKGLKLGDIRDWDEDTECYTIYWEDESVVPCTVPRDRFFVPKCICDKCIESNKQFTHFIHRVEEARPCEL